jgi:hypothetical protein
MVEFRAFGKNFLVKSVELQGFFDGHSGIFRNEDRHGLAWTGSDKVIKSNKAGRDFGSKGNYFGTFIGEGAKDNEE